MTSQTTLEQQVAEAAAQAVTKRENFLFCEDCKFHIEAHRRGTNFIPGGAPNLRLCNLTRDEVAHTAVPMRTTMGVISVSVTWKQWVQAIRTAEEQAYEVKAEADIAEARLLDALGSVRHIRRGKSAQLTGIEQRIRTVAKKISATAARVTDRLDEGRMLNSLGELQSLGLDFDILCARREELRETIAELDAALSEVPQ